MNPTTVKQTGLFNLGMTTILGEGKLISNSLKKILTLCCILLVAEGLGKYKGWLKSSWADQDTHVQCDQMRFIFQHSTPSISVTVFGSHWSKNSSTADLNFLAQVIILSYLHQILSEAAKSVHFCFYILSPWTLGHLQMLFWLLIVKKTDSTIKTISSLDVQIFFWDLYQKINAFSFKVTSKKLLYLTSFNFYFKSSDLIWCL